MLISHWIIHSNNDFFKRKKRCSVLNETRKPLYFPNAIGPNGSNYDSRSHLAMVVTLIVSQLLRSPCKLMRNIFFRAAVHHVTMSLPIWRQQKFFLVWVID